MTDTWRQRELAGEPAQEPPAPAEAPPAIERGGAAAESEQGPASLVGSILAERYRIEKELGSGGMGAVYLAEHVQLRKAVAVKVLHREMTYLPEVVARFEREAVAAARIEHPHVATATDFGQLPDGAFYLVLEYVEGKSLRALLDQSAPIRPDLALHITRQVADALGAAHAAGIVHRDLKPDNVMLIQRDGDEHFVKVLDFGIAKIELGDAQNPLTQLGSVFGTPEYMAPEQASGTPVDARADLYTLGIMLYEMLTGTTPFKDDDLVVVLTRQMTMPPPALPAGVDPALEALLMQLLAKDADQRPQSAVELVARIDGLLPQTIGSSPLSSAMPLTPSPASASPVSMPVRTEESVAFGETVLSLPGAAIAQRGTGTVPDVEPPPGPRTVLSRFFGQIGVRVPVLTKQVPLGGQQLPVWALAGGGAALLLAAVLLLGGVLVAHGVSDAAAGGSAGPTASTASTAKGAVKAPSDEVAVLIQRANRGDRDAVAKLQARPDAQRSTDEWRALGRGYAVLKMHKPSLAGHQRALALDPGLAKDKEVLRDVRAAALDAATTTAALELALGSFGSTGADLVYDVWNSTRNAKDGVEVAKLAKAQVEGAAIRKNASPALLVALDLAKAKACPAFKTLLPRVKSHGDARSLGKLRSLSVRRGCGFLGLGDCFSCLRTNDDLEKAIAAADGRPAPTF